MEGSLNFYPATVAVGRPSLVCLDEGASNLLTASTLAPPRTHLSCAPDGGDNPEGREEREGTGKRKEKPLKHCPNQYAN